MLLCVPVAPAVGMYDTVYMVMRYGEVHGTNYYCIPSRRSTSHSLVQGTAVRSYILLLRSGACLAMPVGVPLAPCSRHYTCPPMCYPMVTYCMYLLEVL